PGSPGSTTRTSRPLRRSWSSPEARRRWTTRSTRWWQCSSRAVWSGRRRDADTLVGGRARHRDGEEGTRVIRTRRTLAGIPRYVPGRSAESVAAEHELEEAVKLASNQAPFGPLPAAIDAAAAALVG